MHVIPVRNVHHALPLALHQLQSRGVNRDSRNGPVRMFPTPVTTVYKKPNERVIFHALRDANPFFHLFESLWMLGGRRDVASVAVYVKRMETFSDDGKTFHGAYGYRWRHHFKFDQLAVIIQALTKNPDDRRCVLGMWDARVDLGKDGKDFPCNTTAMFSVDTTGKLNMLVTNRSNDLIWGAYGANAVHFSFLQEYVASALGREVGTYYQVSNNFHAYVEVLTPLASIASVFANDNPYLQGEVKPFPIMAEGQAAFDLDLETYLTRGPIVGFSTAFFRQVVTPMHFAHLAYKVGDIDRFLRAREILFQCNASDWRKAALEWLHRRETNARDKR